MDRNASQPCCTDTTSAVALRKESVDRNVYQLLAIGKYAVALRKESVDRNSGSWILPPVRYLVALRKESVDRNC